MVARVDAACRKAASEPADVDALAELIAACTDSNSTWSRTRTTKRAWRVYASALDAARHAVWCEVVVQ